MTIYDLSMDYSPMRLRFMRTKRTMATTISTPPAVPTDEAMSVVEGTMYVALGISLDALLKPIEIK